MSSLVDQSPQQAQDEYFEDQNLAFLPAAHPLMSKLQTALKNTLEKDHERVHLNLIEKQGKLKKAEKEKEEIAVQLYEVQQNLAEMHINLEQTHQNYNLIQKLRVEAEEKLSILNDEHESRKVQVERLEKNVGRAQEELSRLTVTVKQIADYNLQVKSEIAVTRRTTYRAEENIGLQEAEKKKQDYLIDHLTEQKKKINEQVTILQAQFLAQTEETKAARDILREAFGEMDSIIMSKKNLVERWQKSLLEMQRRDKALQVARDALKGQYEMNVQVMAEIAGITNETKKEAEHAEVFAASLGRLKLEEKHLEEEHKKLEHEQQKLHAQIKILQQSLQTTETASHAVAKENKRIADQMNIIEDNIMKIHTQAAELYDQVLVKINEHKTLEKTSANLLKQAHMMDRVCDEKDIEREGVENEIARVHLDMLNTTNQIDMLKGKKREVSEERQKKEETVATYELEIRQGHDINEKKQAEVGKLNKVHDSIMSVAGESSRGPLDAHKNHLVNSIKETTEQVQRLERDWIKKQTKLVKYQEQQTKAGDEIGNAKTKKTILEQKRMRLQTILNGHEKEIRGIKISLKNLQTEMNKLNDGIARNNTSETKLKNENYHIQSDVLEKLKELEKTNVKLELDIDSLKEEKADLLQNIVEAERQLLLWERKIQLEKEIQSALDPEIGQAELKVLKKDIHRMELRLEEIRKKQEQTIYEMERQVYKRDTIQLKYIQPDDMEDQKGAKSNQTKIAKQIDNLRSTLAQTSKNNKDYDRKLKQLQAEMNERNTQINEAVNASGVQEEELTDALAELVQRKVERVKNVFEIVKMQTNYRAYETLAANRFKLDFPENVLRQKYEKQRDVNTGLIEVLTEVAETNPQFADAMRSLIRI